jgi:hypothetical protein
MAMVPMSVMAAAVIIAAPNAEGQAEREARVAAIVRITPIIWVAVAVVRIAVVWVVGITVRCV